MARGKVRLITHDGVTLTLSGWAERLGIGKTALVYRLAQGWPVERALTEPLRPWGRHRPSPQPLRVPGEPGVVRMLAVEAVRLEQERCVAVVRRLAREARTEEERRALLDAAWAIWAEAPQSEAMRPPPPAPPEPCPSLEPEGATTRAAG
jgi:hypothetical protein